LSNITLSQGGNYSVVVSNAFGGSSISSNALLTVIPTVPLPIALNATNLTWSTDGDTRWHGLTNVSHDGFAAGRSGQIADGQHSRLATPVTGPGSLSFWWKISSQTNADTLTVNLDGTPQAAISGEVDWTPLSFDVTGGTHTFEWVYAKDGGGSDGQDAAWLDQVTYVLGGKAPAITSQPLPQAVLASSLATFGVTASGTPPLRYQWLVNGAPISGAKRVFLTNSGAEAVECAIKMARRFHYASGAPERYRLVTFEGAFHGRTLATIAAGGSAKYLEGFGPKVEGFDSVPFGDFDAVVRATGPETAGILVEPIQGEVGVRVPPPGFLRRLREFCDARGLLLVFDEVQTGIGRTGRLFAYEELGLVPDIMAVGKGIGGGFPLGACLATERAAKAMTVGTHGSTYGGNPLAMAAGNAVLDIVLEAGFLDRVRVISGSLQQHLAMLAAEHANVIAEVRGRGLLLGLRLHVPAASFIARLRESRFLGVGATENVVRLLPPLNIEERHVKEAMAALMAACVSFETERKAV
jgi:acetylornithine/N-succinyldiaminopimelate aminotransferase